MMRDYSGRARLQPQHPFVQLRVPPHPHPHPPLEKSKPAAASFKATDDEM